MRNPLLSLQVNPKNANSYLNKANVMRFSIRRLIIGTTMIAFALAFAKAYPAFTLRIAFSVFLYAPATIVLAMAISLSSDYRATTLLVVGTSIAGWWLNSKPHIGWSPEAAFLDRYMMSFWNEGIWILSGSLVGFVLSCFWSSRLEHRLDSK